MTDIADLEKKSVLLELVQHILHTPEAEISDPRAQTGYDARKYVHAAKDVRSSQIFAKMAAEMGDPRESGDTLPPIFIDQESGQIKFLLTLSAQDFRRLNPQTAIDAMSFVKVKGKDSPEFNLVAQELATVQQPMLETQHEFALVQKLLGSPLDPVRIQFGQPLFSSSDVQVFATLDIDPVQLNVDAMLQHAQDFRESKKGEIDQIMNTRIAHTADVLADTTQKMTDEQTKQFVSAVIAGLASRRFGGNIPQMDTWMQDMTAALETNRKVLFGALGRLNMIAPMAEMGGAEMAAQALDQALPPSDTQVSPMVIAQVLGEPGLKRMPGLAGPLQKFLAQSMATPALLLTDKTQPIVGDATAAVQEKRGSGSGRGRGGASGSAST